MNKKILLIIISIILSISFVYSNTDIYLDRNNWCQKTQIDFKIYNKTDYDNKNEIDRKLCDPADKCEANDCLGKNEGTDKCDPCDNCLYYRVVEDSKITIYNGPMDSLPILYEGTSKNGEFSVTFPTWNEFLIEIETEEDKNGDKVQGYNDYTEYFEIKTCEHKDYEKNKIKYYNQSYNYLNSEIILDIKNTTINESTEITILTKGFTIVEPENSVKMLAITTKNKEYSNLNIKLKNPTENSKIKLLKYDQTKKTWNEINYKTENQYLILESGELGIYSITQEKKEIIPEETQTEKIVNQENITSENNENKNISKKEEIITKTIKEKNNINWTQISIIIVLVLALVGILYFKFGRKNKINYHDERNQKAKEILTTYEQTYKETTKYVNKYKDEYSKDQIYRALNNSGVPKDIINKVFTEKL